MKVAKSLLPRKNMCHMLWGSLIVTLLLSCHSTLSTSSGDVTASGPISRHVESIESIPPTNTSVSPSSTRIRVTPAVEARCGPDSIRRKPDALADLDRDGALERVSVIREEDTFVVRLHRLPDFAEVNHWRLPGHSIEVGTTKCKGRTDGDLWLHVGVAHDPQGNSWSHKLYHLEGNKLVVAADDIRQSNLFVDVDGDGCTDPLVTDKQGSKLLRRGKGWERLPKNLEPMRLWGRPYGHGQREPVDLDGDGDRDLLQITDQGLVILEATTLKSTGNLSGQLTGVRLTSWQGKTVIVVSSGDQTKVLDTDPQHTELTSVKVASFARLIPDIDPAGDGTILAFHTLLTELLDARAPNRLTKLDVTLARPLVDNGSPLGPVRLRRQGVAELLGVRMIARGSPMIAFSGSEASYELLALLPPGTGSSRVVRHAELEGDLRVEPLLVDLEHDGSYEIVLREVTSFSSCDMRSSGSSSTLYLLDGSGSVLWQDESRSEYHDSGGGMPPDLEAHPRALDLWGDGRYAIRVRAGIQEWYLVPADLPLPDALPVCLE